MKRILLALAALVAIGLTERTSVARGQDLSATTTRRFTPDVLAARLDSLLLRLNDTWAVTRIDRQWLAGRLRNDATLLDSLLVESWIATELAAHGRVFGNAAETKAQYLADLRSGTRSYRSIVEGANDVRIYGDSAVVSGHARSKGYLNDQLIVGTSQFIRTYAKRLGRWRMIASTSTATLE